VPLGEELSPYQQALLEVDIPFQAFRHKTVNVKGDSLRVATADEGKKTVHRFFTARFEKDGQNGEFWIYERYAELQDIILGNILHVNPASLSVQGSPCSQ